MPEVRKDSKGRRLRSGEYEREGGLYAYAYMLNGKRKWLYDHDLAELRKKAKKVERDRDDGIRTLDASKITLNDMFTTYMSTKDSLKPSTLSNYWYLWRKYLQNTDMAMKSIGSIRKSEIKKFYASLLKGGFSYHSLGNVNNLVYPTFELAVDDDLIRKNPSKGVYRSMKKDDARSRDALTIPQQNAFLNFIVNSPTYHHWTTIFVTLLGTGLRVGECVGLTKSDILLDKKLISVNHTLLYRQIEGKCQFLISTPKSEKGTRLVPMIADVEKYLTEHLEILDELYSSPSPEIQGYSEFIFRNRTGDLLNPHSLNRAIERICRDYNAEETALSKAENREPLLLPHFSVHILRHTFCTRLFEVERNHKFIQQVMGHADISTTLDIYTHITDEKFKVYAENMDANISLF